jgi:hypothetical protein
MRNKIEPAYMRAILSEWIVASVLGVISPKIRMITVSVPLAKAMAALPQRFNARVVTREAAERFTMLFPIRIALSIFPESSVAFRTVFDRLSPSSASALSFILFAVVREVSAEEKKAERSTRIISIKNCIADVASKNHHLLFDSNIPYFMYDCKKSKIMQKKLNIYVIKGCKM